MFEISSINELEKQYAELTKEGSIGGSHQLRKISEICLSICLNSGRRRILSSFVLYTIFSNLAAEQDDRMVTTEECIKLYNLLNKSINIIINDLKNPPTDSILNSNVEKLIEDYNKLIK